MRMEKNYMMNSLLNFTHIYNKPEPIRIDPRNVREGLNQKLKTIQNMPFDLLNDKMLLKEFL